MVQKTQATEATEHEKMSGYTITFLQTTYTQKIHAKSRSLDHLVCTSKEKTCPPPKNDHHAKAMAKCTNSKDKDGNNIGQVLQVQGVWF